MGTRTTPPIARITTTPSVYSSHLRSDVVVLRTILCCDASPGGKIEQRLGPRLTVLLGGWTMSAAVALTSFTCSMSQVLTWRLQYSSTDALTYMTKPSLYAHGRYTAAKCAPICTDGVRDLCSQWLVLLTYGLMFGIGVGKPRTHNTPSHHGQRALHACSPLQHWLCRYPWIPLAIAGVNSRWI